MKLPSSQPCTRGIYDRSTPPRIGTWLQYWLYAIPLLFTTVFVVGWLGDRFQRNGNDLALPSQTATAPEPPRQVALLSEAELSEADGWDPRVALAPYASILWLVFATSVGAVLVVELAVAVWRLLPEKRHRPSPGLGNFGEPKDVFVKRQHLLRILENDVKSLFEGRIQVRHVMTRSPVTITPKESLEAACELMESKNVDHLAVCNDDGLLVGMLSHHFARRSDARTVERAMLDQPISVSPDSLLNPTVTQMISAGVSCIAVVAEGYCVGILTTADVQLTLQCALTLLFKVTNDEAVGRVESDPAEDVEERPLNLDEVLESVGHQPAC